MVGVPRGEFFTTDYTDCTDFFYFFRVNSRYSRLILARPCEIPKSQCLLRGVEKSIPLRDPRVIVSTHPMRERGIR